MDVTSRCLIPWGVGRVSKVLIPWGVGVLTPRLLDCLTLLVVFALVLVGLYQLFFFDFTGGIYSFTIFFECSERQDFFLELKGDRRLCPSLSLAVIWGTCQYLRPSFFVINQ